MPFTHFFLLDVSYNAVTTGALQAACSAISRVLDELQGDHHALLVRMCWLYIPVALLCLSHHLIAKMMWLYASSINHTWHC